MIPYTDEFIDRRYVCKDRLQHGSVRMDVGEESEFYR